MIPYIIVLLLLVLLSIAKHIKGCDFLAITVFFFMMLLCGLRGKDVGVDTYNYYSAFQYGSTRYEPICQLLLWLSHIISQSPKGFTMLMAISTYIPLYLFIKKNSENIAFSFLIFLTFSVFFFHETFNTARVYIAIAFALFAYKYALNGKNVKSILFVVISIMSHYSAVVTIPFMLLAKWLGETKFLFIISVVCATIVFGLVFAVGFTDVSEQLSLLLAYNTSGDLSNYYQAHLDTIEQSELNIVGTLSMMLPFSVFVVFLYDEQNSKSLFYKLFFLAVVFQNIFISIVLIYRVTMFFTILITVLLPNTYIRAKGSRKICLLGLSSIMVLWYLYQLINATPDSFAGTIPYQL